MSVIELHRRTLSRSAELVTAIAGDQWELPTPCEQWRTRDLLSHMITENRGFAAAAGGESTDRSVWTSPVGEDLPAQYLDSVDQVIDAFAAPGVLERGFWLPLINAEITHPGRQAVSFHLLDYLVHGWDVAATIGVPSGFDADLVDAVAEIADREVPDGPRRHRTAASFQPALPAPPDASPMERLLCHLGRDPAWTS